MISDNEVAFSLFDLVDLFKKKQKQILGMGLIFSSICFAFLMLKKPTYEAKGSFIVSNEKKQHSPSLNNLFLLVDTQSNTFQSYIKSKKVIRGVVEKLGLQISVLAKRRSVFAKIFRRYGQNIRAISKKPLEDPDVFSFEDVKYGGERPLQFWIRFSSSSVFEIIGQDKKILRKGYLKKKVVLPEMEFTLSKVPQDIKVNTLYPLSVLDFDTIYDDIDSRFMIKMDKHDKNVLHLSYRDPNRILSASFVNEVMIAYQNYLKNENEFFAKEQLNYLVKRKNQLSSQFQNSLEEYSQYLTDNLSHSGFIGIEDEMKVLMKPYCDHMKRLYENDLELAKISSLKDAFLINSSFDKELLAFHQSIQKLSREKDTLEIALASRQKELDNASLDAHIQRIEKVRDDQVKIQDLLVQMNKKSFDEQDFISKHPENIVFLWVEKLNSPFFQKEDKIQYLKNTLRVLSVQEKILNERVQLCSEVWQEFEGIDLKTAQGLYLTYSQKLDTVQTSIQKISHALCQLDEDSFETSSLGAILEDEMSCDLIRKGSDLMFQLNDEKNLSDKDIRRMKQELLLIRSFLKEHLKELLYVQNLQEKNLQDKIHGLQILSLDRINQEISILDQQARDYVDSKAIELGQEKRLLDNKMKELRKDMQTLPEKWKLEKKLKFQSGVALNMIESMIKLVESKTIYYHLNKIGSKPLDLASLPYLPVRKSFPVFLILFFVLGVFLSYMAYFIQTSYRGFPVSIDNLKGLGQNVLGNIHDQCDGPNISHIADLDFETLRNASHFIQSSSCSTASLLISQGPNYAHCLASILGKCGKKTLLLDTDFYRTTSKVDEKGLLQALENQEQLSIKSFDEYDYMATGGKSRFGNEILRSPSFQKFIEHLKGKYDTILLFTRVNPILSETKTYMSVSDKVIISFEKETLKELSPFFNKDKIGYVKILRSYL